MEFEKEHRCKQCAECREIRRQEWAARIIHEAEKHGDNVTWLTMTYAPEYLPGPPGKYGAGSLCKKHMEKFWKRLRKNNPDLIIMYFQVGEYGGKRHRPHYHAVVFGLDPFRGELEYWRAWSEPGKESRESLREKGVPSEIARKLKGRKFFGNVKPLPFSPERAGYITGYSLKKQTTKKNFVQAHGIDGREPEFMSCSKGIGLTLADQVVDMMQKNKMAVKDKPQTNHWGEKAIVIPFPRFLQERRQGKVVNSIPLDETIRQRIADLLRIEPDSELRKGVVGEMRQNYEENRPLTLTDIYNDWLTDQAIKKREKRKRKRNLIPTSKVE